MFTVLWEGLTWQHVDNKKIEERIKNNPVMLQVYNTLTIGVNVRSLSAYNDIAEYLITLTDAQLKKITMDDVFESVGEYIDSSGTLV